MKKNINIYIVGILALLLLGVNMVTLKKYKALKTYCQGRECYFTNRIHHWRSSFVKEKYIL